MKIELKAYASYPTIYFSQPYVIMPTVPLSTESSATFQIFNGGYENINLKHTIQKAGSNVKIKI